MHDWLTATLQTRNCATTTTSSEFPISLIAGYIARSKSKKHAVSARDLTVSRKTLLCMPITIWFLANRTPHHHTCGVQSGERELPTGCRATRYACGVSGLPDRDDGGGVCFVCSLALWCVGVVVVRGKVSGARRWCFRSMLLTMLCNAPCI